MNKISSKQSKGFTIVELLIVIVTIGILASISILAYTGVQGRAKDATIQSNVNTIRQSISLYHAQYNSYPSYNDLTTNSVIGALANDVSSFDESTFTCQDDITKDQYCYGGDDTWTDLIYWNNSQDSWVDFYIENSSGTQSIYYCGAGDSITC